MERTSEDMRVSRDQRTLPRPKIGVKLRPRGSETCVLSCRITEDFGGRRQKLEDNLKQKVAA